MPLSTRWRLLIISILLIALAIFGSEESHAQFIFTGNKVINSRNEREFVRLSERLPIPQLRKRFASSNVTATANEDCSICASVSRGGTGIEIHYDENGLFVTGIFGRDRASTDAFGNAVGSSLMRTQARCELGDETVCASPRLDGLWYIVEESNSCVISIQNQKADTKIPSCARIGGFAVTK
jgi:hypothetical protein